MTVEVRLHRFQECGGPCGGPCMGWTDRLGIPGCSVRRTYEVYVKPFGSTVKKEVRIVVESREKIWGYVGGVGEFENEGKSPWGPGKGPKKF